MQFCKECHLDLVGFLLVLLSRSSSANIMPAATETFKDCMSPLPGMVTRLSQRLFTRSERPSCSLPSTTRPGLFAASWGSSVARGPLRSASRVLGSASNRPHCYAARVLVLPILRHSTFYLESRCELYFALWSLLDHVPGFEGFWSCCKYCFNANRCVAKATV